MQAQVAAQFSPLDDALVLSYTASQLGPHLLGFSFTNRLVSGFEPITIQPGLVDTLQCSLEINQTNLVAGEIAFRIIARDAFGNRIIQDPFVRFQTQLLIFRWLLRSMVTIIQAALSSCILLCSGIKRHSDAVLKIEACPAYLAQV